MSQPFPELKLLIRQYVATLNKRSQYDPLPTQGEFPRKFLDFNV